MNCMALDIPCAPLGHILDMFSPRSLNTTGGRRVPCKFTGVYSASSSTPRLTGWSKNLSEDFVEELPCVTPSFQNSQSSEKIVESTAPISEASVDLDSDSGHSSESEESNVDTRYVMPLASEAFETVMLELKEEEEAVKGNLEVDASISDCSDDSFDFGVHTVYSESPTLDRATSRVPESECSQFCCSKELGEPTECKTVGTCSPVLPRRVRFADHVRSSQKFRASQRASHSKATYTVKPILKSPSEYN